MGRRTQGGPGTRRCCGRGVSGGLQGGDRTPPERGASSLCSGGSEGRAAGSRGPHTPEAPRRASGACTKAARRKEAEAHPGRSAAGLAHHKCSSGVTCARCDADTGPRARAAAQQHAPGGDGGRQRRTREAPKGRSGATVRLVPPQSAEKPMCRVRREWYLRAQACGSQLQGMWRQQSVRSAQAAEESVC